MGQGQTTLFHHLFLTLLPSITPRFPPSSILIDSPGGRQGCDWDPLSTDHILKQQFPRAPFSNSCRSTHLHFYTFAFGLTSFNPLQYSLLSIPSLLTHLSSLILSRPSSPSTAFSIRPLHTIPAIHRLPHTLSLHSHAYLLTSHSSSSHTLPPPLLHFPLQPTSYHLHVTG
ncbi:uncharacterized protein BDV17DRAFT_260530 [Aspergillus undulatus]|uniref:uncharacterized protein n=1 Tax=Aspergillus undulatus TaxID=1810928 RepID=UPI003CCD8BD6